MHAEHPLWDRTPRLVHPLELPDGRKNLRPGMNNASAPGSEPHAQPGPQPAAGS